MAGVPHLVFRRFTKGEDPKHYTIPKERKSTDEDLLANSSTAVDWRQKSMRLQMTRTRSNRLLKKNADRTEFITHETSAEDSA